MSGQDVVVTEADTNQGETPKENQDEYFVPDWFLANNVKTAAELDGLEFPCRIVFSDTNNTSEKTANTNEKDAFKSADADIPKYQVSYDTFSELRDVTAAAFIRDRDGNLSPSHSGVLLCSSTDSDAVFINGILLHLTKDLQATLVSVDLEDFEDLGWEFDRQDMDIEKQKMNVDGSAEPEPTKEEPDRTMTSLAAMAVHYFGVQPERYASESSWNRSKKAISAVLNAQGVNRQQRKIREEASQATSIISSEATVNDAPPLLVHVRHCSEIRDLSRDYTILARLCDAVQERRKSGQRIVLLVSLFESEFDKYDQKSVAKKISAGEASTVTIAPSHHGKVSSGKNNRAREVILRRLKRFLQWHIPHLLASEVLDVLQPHSHWAVPGLDGKRESIEAPEWENNDFQRAFTQITGRAFGKPCLDLKDIGIVLSRIGLHETKESKEETSSDPNLDSTEDTTLEAKPESWSEKLKRLKKQANDYERKLIDCIVNPDDLQYTYDDVIMDEEAKETIKHLVSLSNFKPEAASAFLLRQIRITGALFYGPPGTGKTHLSRAIAGASGSNMLAVDGATIRSKWVGNTEKYIKAAFALATKLFPCVLFIDEVDSLFYRRSSGDVSWQRSALAEFLCQMDGLIQSDSAPFVVVATNRPGDLDEAFYRRLPQKIYFKLPDTESRAKILKLFLKEEDLDPLVDINGLARQTDGYSGSDLRSFCAEAALIWAVEQVKGGEKKGAGMMGRLRLKPVHFAKAMARIRPSVSNKSLDGLSEFMRQFYPEATDIETTVDDKDTSSVEETPYDSCQENGNPSLLESVVQSLAK